MTESPILLPDLPGVAVQLRRSARARRFSLRVSRIDGAVTLTLPTRARLAEAVAFAQGQGEWLRAALEKLPQQHRPGFGDRLPFEGRMVQIEAAALRAPRLEGDRLLVPPDAERLGTRLEIFLKHCARRQLQSASERHAAQLGRPFRRITLRDTRSRWGSCAADGSLSFSWRLVMAPPEVLDYVAAHEVAHLVQMNHSPAFWAVVARLCPDYARHRLWLRQNGSELQAIRLRD